MATVRANDGILSDTESFDIVVTDINTAPVLESHFGLSCRRAVPGLLVSATDAERTRS